MLSDTNEEAVPDEVLSGTEVVPERDRSEAEVKMLGLSRALLLDLEKMSDREKMSDFGGASDLRYIILTIQFCLFT